LKAKIKKCVKIILKERGFISIEDEFVELITTDCVELIVDYRVELAVEYFDVVEVHDIE
jgi:hypothetical protein